MERGILLDSAGRYHHRQSVVPQMFMILITILPLCWIHSIFFILVHFCLSLSFLDSLVLIFLPLVWFFFFFVFIFWSLCLPSYLCFICILCLSFYLVSLLCVYFLILMSILLLSYLWAHFYIVMIDLSSLFYHSRAILFLCLSTHHHDYSRIESTNWPFY